MSDEDPDMGIQAIGLVSDPAILENFIYFNKDVEIGLTINKTEGGANVRDFYKYTAEPEPETIETSHDFCKKHAGNVYHVSEINEWGALDHKRWGFNTDSSFFATFRGIGSFNVNQQIFNCRHWLKQCKNIREIPTEKRTKSYKTYYGLRKETSSLDIEFKISNKEKREIEGLALQSGQFIYRNDINGMGPGYVYFSRETIRKLWKKYGFNRTITIEHSENITGTAILLDSWLDENDDTNITKWYLRYKILDESLWNAIKLGLVRGYSIEGIFDVR